MKKLSLKTKMLLCILPVMAIAMIILTYIAAQELSTNMQEIKTLIPTEKTKPGILYRR